MAVVRPVPAELPLLNPDLVTVTVKDTNGDPKEGLPVYVFDGSSTGYSGTSDVNGEVEFDLSDDSYRFRSDMNGTQFWSGESYHSDIPGCSEAAVEVTIPVTVTVKETHGWPVKDASVYAFDGTTYTGYSGISDMDGEVVFTLPTGDYLFRADYERTQFWSDDVDHCTIPGCLDTTVEIPGGTGEVDVTIDYYYDPLYRLTDADYSMGEYFWYTYDAVGNRMTQETHEEVNSYIYDIANRLIEVDGVTYTWDDNGNLLSDGVSTYTYDRNNRLMGVVQGDDEYEFEYNGLGDRLSQSVNGEWTDYTLDLVAGLTQVLDNGENGYLYGIGRIGEDQVMGGWQYHLGDALGSVRQLTNAGPEVKRADSYQPFGKLMMGAGSTSSDYGFTGEPTELG